MQSKITNSKIFITGGAGFIGSYVVEQLLEHSPARICILDNFIRGSHENMKNFSNNPIVKFVEGDIRNEALLEECIKDSDYVYHMAALRINACAADPNEGFEVMLKATFNLANFCVKHKVKKVIYSSTASVYGLAQNFPTPESDNPYNNQTFYGGAKIWGEQLFRSYKFMYNLDYVALRYFNVYGSRMDTDGKYTEVMIKWLDCIRDRKQPAIFGDGSDSMDFVHVTDVAKANVLALLGDVTDESFNVGDQVETNLKEMLTALLKVNNADLSPVFKEANSVNPVSRRLADISKAKRLLGYTPDVSLEGGLKELSTWYFDKQKQKVN
ncbi:MAG: NAD-dependent epimerase/dehydratase family protein [Bacteroidota bacterium]|jgi:UDP-glucose 4-epimerase|nr:NAD-dependent epimerase/dehydratase family protein [Bacteroidota bacterium]MCA6442035.1 NAD-dependent epimerase/dehydratase family protein [Bacteroidota bacterium]